MPMSGQMSTVLCIYVHIMQLWINLCPIISVSSSPYNIVKCGFCLTVLCLFDNLLSLVVCGCH